MKAILVTGRSLTQGMGLELGKFSDTYYRSGVACEMNSGDMEELGLESGGFVKVMSDHGEVVLRAVEAAEEVPSGMIFIPYGPWVNLVVRSETHGTGMPSYKGVDVEVEAVGESDIPGVEDLVKLLGR
jgi:formylmethanofuran dehydrogenase subunit D